MPDVIRCAWARSHPLEVEYHDTEWGEPVYDDRKLFEYIILDGAQAGLSWLTVLKKREGYRAAFANFDPALVARFSDADAALLMQNPGIIRNRAKINSAMTNARAFLNVQEEFTKFASYIWRFVDGNTIVHTYESAQEIPSTSTESDAMSKDLKARGFNFVGSTICYAFMQAAGMVNDHIVDCFRYLEVQRSA